MSYENIDKIMDNLAHSSGIEINREVDEPFRRFFHTSSKRGETFQVIVEPEMHGQARIDAHLVESWIEEEVQFTFHGPIDQFSCLIDVCVKSVKQWLDR